MSRLLIITQKVDINDGVLGFFHEWIRRFAERFDKVTVICLKKGEYNLPPNVKVLSLGKETYGHYPAVVRRALFFKKFYSYIRRERNNYDAVFVHMNPKYVVLGAPLWKIWDKKISLWYAHGHVGPTLQLADKMTDIAFTSTPEGYRLKSDKLVIVGQGIDTEKFKNQNSKIKIDDRFRIISVGRITASKDYGTLIQALSVLGKDLRDKLEVSIVGDTWTDKDTAYLSGLKDRIAEKGLSGTIKFSGPIANKDLPGFLQSADLFVNMGLTGSLDKAILEAMASGLPVLTCNEALKNVLGLYADKLMYPKEDSGKLSEKISLMMKMGGRERASLGAGLRDIVIRDHNIDGLIGKISNSIKGVPANLNVGDIYNRQIKGKFEGNYEYHRWKSSPVKRAGYEMTRSLIRGNILKSGLGFRDYLEVGPGPGTWTKMFLEASPKANFDLVDISSEMLNLAKQNLAGHGNLRYIETDFLRFNPDKKYDIFFSSRAIEYMPDKDGLVKKISDLLRPGGRGFVITKNPKYLRSKLAGRHISEFHKGQISPETFRALLIGNGFKDVEIYPVTFVFPVFNSAFMNRTVSGIFSYQKLNTLNNFFAESYLIRFKKPN
ncbi:MAG: Glycosyltransferase [Candidatus Yanofskybacteria bacterium GW2011_GWA2_44_9]|nr:MAG: Glycosyltransferase [Candidatus Yanofskybacteria bacterium GW2011_GWA2_44_9]